jgi:hypothetical protein
MIGVASFDPVQMRLIPVETVGPAAGLGVEGAVLVEDLDLGVVLAR